MKRIVGALVSAAVFLSACNQADVDNKANASPAKAAEEKAAALPADVPSEHVFHYTCQSGELVQVAQTLNDNNSLLYKGKLYRVVRVISASGARYAGDGMEWWTKGDQAMLSPLLADGTSGNILESCAIQTKTSH